MKKCAFIVILVFIVFPVLAELPPEVYREAVSKAGEILIIHIGEVSAGQWSEDSRGIKQSQVSLTATVLYVKRSTSNLSVGDNIEVRYTATKYPMGWCGPSPIGMQKEGDISAAYLKEHWGHYIPAARGMTFSSSFWPDGNYDQAFQRAKKSLDSTGN